jgi:hypothetical protein
MPQLSTLSARKAAATLPRHVRRSHRTASRVAGAAKPRTLSTIKALVAPPNDDTARFLPSTSSLPSSSTQNVAPRVRVFEKLASAVAINVSQMREHGNWRRERGAEDVGDGSEISTVGESICA